MSGEDALGTIAEIGAALAGFVALVTVLSGRDGRLQAADSLRVRGLIMMSLVTTLLAVLPVALASAGLRDVTLWRVASIGGLVLIGAAAVQQRRVELSSGSKWVREVGLERWIAWVLGVSAALLMAANASGLAWEPFAGGFVPGLFLLLAGASALFLGLVTQRLL